MKKMHIENKNDHENTQNNKVLCFPGAEWRYSKHIPNNGVYKDAIAQIIVSIGAVFLLFLFYQLSSSLKQINTLHLVPDVEKFGIAHAINAKSFNNGSLTIWLVRWFAYTMPCLALIDGLWRIVFEYYARRHPFWTIHNDPRTSIPTRISTAIRNNLDSYRTDSYYLVVFWPVLFQLINLNFICALKLFLIIVLASMFLALLFPFHLLFDYYD